MFHNSFNIISFFEIIKTGKQTSLTSIINGNSQIVS